MLTNLATVVRQSAITGQIIREIDADIRRRQEQTKHACVNCVFFSGNEYLMCAVNPQGSGVSDWEVNDCRDWELATREVVR